MLLLAMFMEISWVNQQKQDIKIKSFLKQKKVSRRLLSAIRYHGGKLMLNGQDCRKIDFLKQNDQLTLRLPAENPNHLQASYVPVEIYYEDRDYLVVNKPPRLASIPSPLHPNDSLINRVWGYYQIRHYQGITPHIITRLDRDTSGLVLLAKHRFAHALLNDQPVKIEKEYFAFLTGRLTCQHLLIALPLSQDPTSLIKRQVTLLGGKTAITELKTKKLLQKASFCQLRLHTGRTHQIRVHCAYLGHPLVADTLYGGKITKILDRQALHCKRLKFWQPFEKKFIEVNCCLPQDMKRYLIQNS